MSVLQPPTTRYIGSKRKISNWILTNLNQLKFDTFLECFGGTGSIGYMMKTMGKTVTYNDKLRFNYHIGNSIIANNTTTLDEKDVEFLIKPHKRRYPNFITQTFPGMYYTDSENTWLDMMIANINMLSSNYKKSIAFNALFQACIRKRPYNLFHRKNLYMRFADVDRSFCNKTTWDTPFESHFRNFIKEINEHVFNNQKKNKAFNQDVFNLHSDFDMVYVDSPYMSAREPVNYKKYYHFLEGMALYPKWAKIIDYSSYNLRMKNDSNPWNNKTQIQNLFDSLFDKFKKSIIVVSYRSGGIPNEIQIKNLLKKYKKNIILKRKYHKYVLSKKSTRELLFIGY